jgi:hypothetical protein
MRSRDSAPFPHEGSQPGLLITGVRIPPSSMAAWHTVRAHRRPPILGIR